MKKILIALLAVAVIFSFAACDNSTGTGSGSYEDLYVTSISVSKAADAPAAYFDGEAFDIEDYVVVATQLNGETVNIDVTDGTVTTSLDGKKYTINGTDNDAAKAVEITFTYLSTFAPAPVQAKISVPVYKLTNFSVTGDQKQYYVGQDETDINRDDYVVTGYALDSKDTVLFERALAADEYTINEVASDAISGTKFTSGQKALPVAPTYNDSATAVNATAKTDITITVIPDSVDTISVALKKNAEAVVGGTATAASDYVDVTFNMVSGEKVTSGYTANVAWESGFDVGSKFTDAARTITATYGSGTTAKTATVQITPVPNYIKSFTLAVESSAASHAVIGTTTKSLLMVNDDINTSDFTVLDTGLVWAAGSAPTTGAPDSAALKSALCMTDGIKTDLKTFATDGYTDGNTLPVKFYLDNSFVNEKTTCNITTVQFDADLTEAGV